MTLCESRDTIGQDAERRASSATEGETYALRLVVPALLLLTSLFFLAPSARAGTYYWSGTDPKTGKPIQSPTYTGGDYSNPNNNSSNPPGPRIPDALVPNEGWGGGTGAGYGINPQTKQSFTGSADCGAAPISVTFTWKHDNNSQTDQTDPPPPVIVEETTTSGWSATGPGAGGSFSNPYKCPVSASPTGFGSSETGVHLSTKSGADTLSFSGSLTASATGSGSGPGVYSLSVRVNYSVFVLPITINIVGTNLPFAGDNRALTGQQITASVEASYGLPPGTKVTGYTWSLSGGHPIKYWDTNAPGDGQLTQIIQLAPADYVGLIPIGSDSTTINPISFYDEFDQDAITVKCAVTLQLPDFTTQIVNAVSPQVTFSKPSVTKWDVVTGYVQGVFSKTLNLGGLALVPVPGSLQQGGEAWNNVTINVPSPFSGGQGCFAQLITPDTEITNDDPAKSITGIGSKHQGLDNAFPYAAPYAWNVAAVGASADNPGGFFSNYNNPVYQGFNTVMVSDDFTTWVMYMPPAVGSQGTIWVPLQKYSWSWSFTAQWLNNPLTGTAAWTKTAASPATAADDPKYKPTGVMNIPPQWNMVQNNSK